jgi:predicted anti-sigma-YlaC factor YlaD
MRPINCSDFLAEIGNLLDGEVGPELLAHLEGHLKDCRACEVMYDSTRKTIRVLAGSQSFELPPQAIRASSGKIMARIRAMENKGASP